MLKAIIIEDEKHCITRLHQLLRNFSKEITVISEFNSIKSSVLGINRINPDLVFMDVELKDGNCFDLLKKVKSPNFEIIFTTAHNKYAIKAFEYSAIHYLLKPIDYHQFYEAIKRCIEKFKNQQTNERLESMIHNIMAHSFQEKKIAFPSTNGYRFYKPGEIVRLQSEGNFSTVKLFTGETFLTTKPIKYYEDLLSKKVFFRVHQSHLVNLTYVDQFLHYKSNIVKLSTNDEIPVSVRKRSDFINFLLKNKQL